MENDALYANEYDACIHRRLLDLKVIYVGAVLYTVHYWQYTMN